MRLTGTELVLAIVSITLIAVTSIFWTIGYGERTFVARVAAHCIAEGGAPFRSIDNEDVVCLFDPRPLIMRPR